MRWIAGTLALLLAAAVAQGGDLVPTDARYGPLRVALHKVDVSIDNQIAITRVEQVFANDHGVQLEGMYTFPVPKGATIIDFSMTINGKLMRGELLERDRARSIYEGIVRQAKDPGLLEHVGANIFRLRVFPILPRAEQKIELTYVERVNYDAGSCRYVYPLLVPGGAKTTRADRFDFRLRLASLVPIKEVTCPTHPAAVARRAEESAELRYEAKDVDLSKDFEVNYRIARAASGMDLVAHRPGAEDGTFMLLLTPDGQAPALPKDMTFVFDTSGSMEGKRIRQAKAALRFCLAKLKPEDRFNILTFSGDVTAFSPGHLPAGDAEKERAAKFVDAIDASGSTNISAALLRALEHKAAEGRPHLVLFLTDGRPTAGVQNPAELVRQVLAANRAGVRLFAFGVGEDLDRTLLEDLAEGTRAVAEHVAESEDIEEKVSRLQKKIGTTVISELSIDWGGAEVGAVFPKNLGDLYAGTQLMVTGRYKKAGTFEVTLRGKAGAKAVELKQQLSFPERIDVAPGVPYLWAMRRVATLLDEIRKHGENGELVKEVVEVSKKHRIASPYTSFLVLETEQAYDQHGVDRKSARWQPPAPTAKATAPAGAAPADLVYRKDAEEADHLEAAEDESFKRAKGDSLDVVSDKPFKGKGVYDVIGGGGGGGGRYGTRYGGKRNLTVMGGGSAETLNAVDRALRWLAKHQKPDGSWDAENPEFRVGNTGLSLLAFLGAGYTHLSKDTHEGICFGDVVRKALQYLLSHQDVEGCLAPRSGSKYMYNHAIAALALAEAYGLTGSNLFLDQAQKAVDFLASAQNPGKGWRYSAKPGDNDSSVTGWAVLAFKSSELSGLRFPRAAYDGARAWFDEATDERSRTGYTMKGTGKVFLPGRSEVFEHHETLTAAAMTARIFMDKNKADPRLAAGAALLLKDLPSWKDDQRDYVYWHWATLALFQFDGPAGPAWKAWNEGLKEVVVKNQAADGSWHPGDRWSTEGGGAYATAINALTLEVYYRYPHVFGSR